MSKGPEQIRQENNDILIRFHNSDLPSNKTVDPAEHVTERATEDIEAEQTRAALDKIHAGFVLIDHDLPDPYIEEHPEILE